MNIIGTLCVYASICKYKGLSFNYPGNRITCEQFMDVFDVELIVKQEIWAAMKPCAKNQAFNCSNSDVVNGKNCGNKSQRNLSWKWYHMKVNDLVWLKK